MIDKDEELEEDPGNARNKWSISYMVDWWE